jgi:polyhydroxyalkanoate synthesis regulator phasin
MSDSGDTRRQGPKERVSESIRQGIGVLSAFKEALEETIQEARDRGDLSTERAKQVMRDALDRAQSAAGDAKERLDFVHQSELDDLRAELDTLRARVSALEAERGGEGSGT